MFSGALISACHTHFLHRTSDLICYLLHDYFTSRVFKSIMPQTPPVLPLALVAISLSFLTMSTLPTLQRMYLYAHLLNQDLHLIGPPMQSAAPDVQDAYHKLEDGLGALRVNLPHALRSVSKSLRKSAVYSVMFVFPCSRPSARC